MNSEAAAFLWFNSSAISDAGHAFYGRYVYEQVLEQLASKTHFDHEAWFVLFDGDCLSAVGPVSALRNYFRAEDGRLLEQIDGVRESSICYVVAVLGQWKRDWAELGQALSGSGMTGYIGMTLARDAGRDRFQSVCKDMALCLAMRIDDDRLKKIDFGLLPDARLKELGFELNAEKPADEPAQKTPPETKAPTPAPKPKPRPATDRKRAIRVFVSSTFRDMQAERDQLVKFVFPQLRKLCESRGVACVEVDLRWGITNEAARAGHVLRLCLEEIHHCRPYFIGLLGERYGWVNSDISADLIKNHAWLEKHRDRSVTELEIVHGVLGDEQMHGQAYFYFRDRGYLDRLPPGTSRADFEEKNSPDKAAKLDQLKQRIRNARDEQMCHLRENYRDVEELGRWILEDFTRLINEQFPEDREPDALEREAADHDAFARSRARVYIGGQKYFDELNAYVEGQRQPLVVLGESGSGKSALLANWAERYRMAHPKDFLVMHFIGATPHSSDWVEMLRRVMGELKRRFDLPQEIPDKPAALRDAFGNWLSMAAAKGRIVLILDALNQLEDRDGAPDLVWLPAVIPNNVRMILSTLPGRSFDEIRKRGWSTLEVEPLKLHERSQLITEYLDQYKKGLDQAPVERIVIASQCSNPLYLRALLEELRVFGSHERLEARIAHYLEARTIIELYDKVLARWETDYGGDGNIVREATTLLWAARRGLSESELLEMLGTDDLPLPHAHWSPLFLAAEPALVNRSGLLNFFHEYLRAAVQQRYLPGEEQQRSAHRRLAGYFETEFPGPRRTDELPWQLARVADWPRLYDLLAEREFFMDAWRQNEFDVKNYWSLIESASALRKVEAYRKQIDQPEAEPDKRFLWWLGFLLGDTGHAYESYRLRSALVEHFKGNADMDNLQAGLGNQASNLLARGDVTSAMALCQEQEKICRQLKNYDGLQASLGNQGIILKMRGNADGAMTLFQEQERICRQNENPRGLSVSLGNQGLIFQDRKDLDKAMELFKEGERLCRQLGDLDELQGNLGNQGINLELSGKLVEAMALYKEQQQICGQLGSPLALQRCLGNQANVLFKRGDYAGAMALHKDVEKVFRQSGNLDGLSICLGNQALICKKMGKTNEALSIYKEEERICRQLGKLDELEGCLFKQAVILESSGEQQAAALLYREVKQIIRGRSQ